MSQELKRTRLFDWHVDHGARMVPFAGWEMPVQYPTGPIEEHRTTRRSAGLFDIDHMGQFEVTGSQAGEFLNRLVTWDTSIMAENDAHYALMCYDNGGIVDDIFLYKQPGRWIVVVNADNLDKDFQWLQDHAQDYDVSLRDISDETYMVALQGPRALDLLQKLTSTELVAIPRFTSAELEVAGIPTLVGRTGYTGEDGVEIYFSADRALALWESILDSGQDAAIEVKPIGLAARDSLRFEPSFPLYGHEIDANTTPLEANLGWVCKFGTDFVGKESLLEQKETGLTKKLVGFELKEKGVPRQGYPILAASGEEIGTVATGLYAPTVEKYCGNAFVTPQYAPVGTEIKVLVRNKPKSAVVIKRPFYKPAYR
jgi:glycine cleavage system T protein